MSTQKPDGWPEMRSTVLGAARRQLDCAIRLLFSREDGLAVHTLALASYNLLYDLAKQMESDTVRRLNEDASYWKGTEFWSELKALSNDLKHGDKVPAALLRGVPEELNEAILLTSCFLLRDLDALSTPETQALWLWHHAIFFIDIEDVPDAYDDWLMAVGTSLHADTRADLVELGATLLEQLRASSVFDHKMEPAKLLLPWRLVIQPGRSLRGAS